MTDTGSEEVFGIQEHIRFTAGISPAAANAFEGETFMAESPPTP